MSYPQYPIDRLIFMPPKQSPKDHAWPTISYIHDGPNGKPDHRRVCLSKKISPPSGSSTNQLTLVFCGGNATSLSHGNFDLARMIEGETGIDTYAFDYPGYGLSTGPPAPDLAVDALLTLVRALKAAGHSFICLWGYSLGTGVAVKAASLTDDIKGLILVAPFSHTLAVTPWRRFGVLPAGWIDPFPSKTLLETIDIPVSIIHGDCDDVILYAESEILFEAAMTNFKSHLRMDGYGHNDLFRLDFPFEKVRYFLEGLQKREVDPTSLASGTPKVHTET